jgi:hypothetical protein
MVAIQIPRQPAEWPGERPGGVAAPAPVRLPDRATRIRRRRLAVLVLALAVAGATVLGARSLTGLATVGESPHPQPVEVRPVPVAGQQYVVQPGDTLWSIATQIAPDDDPRAVVDALRAANGGPDLEVGARLTLDLG